MMLFLEDEYCSRCKHKDKCSELDKITETFKDLCFEEEEESNLNIKSPMKIIKGEKMKLKKEIEVLINKTHINILKREIQREKFAWILEKFFNDVDKESISPLYTKDGSCFFSVETSVKICNKEITFSIFQYIPSIRENLTPHENKNIYNKVIIEVFERLLDEKAHDYIYQINVVKGTIIHVSIFEKSGIGLDFGSNQEYDDMSEEELRALLQEFTERPENKELLDRWKQVDEELEQIEKYLDEQKPKFESYISDSSGSLEKNDMS
nr:MAG: hypothetical protein [Lokiarchaeota virus Skoll Meg22_1214]